MASRSAPARGAIDDCRRAEALLHAGRREEALALCRRAFPETDIVGDAASLQICAWVFSNCGCHADAAEAYRQLVRLRPDWAEGYRHWSASLIALGRPEEAMTPALRAAALAPHDSGIAVHAAELLMRRGAAEDAAALLREAADHSVEPPLLRVLSAAEMLCGRLPEALAAIDRALAGAGANVEYHIHRGHLLWQLDDLAGAAAALERAAALDPASGEVRRAQLSLYLSAGLVSEATAVGGALLQRCPDDRPAAEAVLHLLNHRLDTIDGDYVVLGGADPRAPRPLRPPPGWRQRWRSQTRIIAALMIRETRTRFADLKLGYGWALIEPILHIALLSVMFSVLMHGRPPIGR
ncbi:MAG TPA: tetratricopeptide repeat protein, partial [Stellaceae bacterium]|nr:tetratricopeptide repeat protein [Stellaceae bacterium]